jgi:hypothetical protein
MAMRERPYMRLAVVLIGSFVVVLGVGHALTERAEHIHVSADHLYLALMAIAPIGILLLFLLGELFPSKKMNYGLGAAFAVVFVGAFVGARTQAGVSESDFAGAMISHHSHAVTRCGNASLKDPRLIAFCERMTTRNRAEIAELENILGKR